jgi:hypothetical protein
MAPLLAVGLSLVALAAAPRRWRPAVFVALGAAEAALAVRALTGDAFLVGAAALVAGLLAIVVREMLSTFSMLTAPSAEQRRRRELERSAYERGRAAAERERRRQQRDARRARTGDGIAA